MTTNTEAVAQPVIEIWTDGGCSPTNPGPGGWAAVLRRGIKEREVSGAEPAATNQRMELTAAAAALESLRIVPSDVVVHTDSEYVRSGVTVWSADWVRRGWRNAKGKPVANRDLWERLLVAAARHRVEWRWVKGHAGDPMNERADALVARARAALL